jgi:predicted membrane channel-forming protein YqfA (hemolysin III family)
VIHDERNEIDICTRWTGSLLVRDIVSDPIQNRSKFRWTFYLLMGTMDLISYHIIITHHRSLSLVSQSSASK